MSESTPGFKYSILAYNQNALCNSPAIIDNKIDLVDLFLMEWFSDFTQSDGMCRKDVFDVVETETGELEQTVDTYFWIKYGYIAECLPFLSLSAERIRKRFARLVKAGLLDRSVATGSDRYIQNRKQRSRSVLGKLTYYRLTDEYYKLRCAGYARTVAEQGHKAVEAARRGEK